ncbi:MAG: DUF4423 domain-containing protein [Bdellovibrionales bacterium]|nr:DUF4423 domain-containing protein [Bdellovibrionales bacterium]
MQTATDYRDLLKVELTKRRLKNPRYSLRAFARDLKLGPEWLSRIFSGQEGLSRARALDISQRLGFDESTTQTFCDLVESKHGRSAEDRRNAKLRLQLRLEQRVQNLSLDAFLAMREWYHLAILQLVALPGFKCEGPWLARRLHITPIEAKHALARLQKLELLTQNEFGEWQAPTAFLAGPDGISSEAIRAFHEQILRKSLTALQNESFATRSITTAMLPFDTQHLPQAREAIRKFRQSFEQQMPESNTKNSVYALAVQFIRVDSATTIQD